MTGHPHSLGNVEGAPRRRGRRGKRVRCMFMQADSAPLLNRRFAYVIVLEAMRPAC